MTTQEMAQPTQADLGQTLAAVYVYHAEMGNTDLRERALKEAEHNWPDLSKRELRAELHDIITRSSCGIPAPMSIRDAHAHRTVCNCGCRDTSKNS